MCPGVRRTARPAGRAAARTGAAAGRSPGRGGLAVAGRRGRLAVAGRRGGLAVARRRGRLAVTGRRGRRLGHLRCVGCLRPLRCVGCLRRGGRVPLLAVRLGRRGGRRHRGTGGRGVQRGDDGRRGVHAGAGCGRRRRGGALRRGGVLRRCEALCGGLRRRGRGGGLLRRGRGGGRGLRRAGDAERRGCRGLGGRREPRGGAGLRLLRSGRLLLGHLAAEVLQQGVEAAVEALADRGEPPHVLEVEVTQHHGTLGGELRPAEGVPGHFLAARDDTDVPGAHLRHLAGAVDRRGEGQLLDLRRDAVQRDPEGLRVAGLRPQELNGLLGRLRLVVEDEVTVVREPFVGVQTEATDVEGQPGAGDLHAYVQIRARGEVTDPGLVAALEFPGHAYDRPPSGM